MKLPMKMKWTSLSKSIAGWNKVVYKNKINLTSHEVQTEMETVKFKVDLNWEIIIPHTIFYQSLDFLTTKQVHL